MCEQYGMWWQMCVIYTNWGRKMAAKYFEHTLANQSVVFYTL